MPKPRDPCKKYACKIQDCLDRNHYQEERCLDELEDMRQCCLKWHRESFCCEGIKLDKVYKATNESPNPGTGAAKTQV